MGNFKQDLDFLIENSLNIDNLSPIILLTFRTMLYYHPNHFSLKKNCKEYIKSIYNHEFKNNENNIWCNYIVEVLTFALKNKFYSIELPDNKKIAVEQYIASNGELSIYCVY